MKEYKRNHRPARRTRLWQAGVTEKKMSLPTSRSILRSSATAKDELW
jgi:hypothetical protein